MYVQVFLVALLFSMIFKKADLEEDGLEDEEEIKALSSKEEWLHFYPNDERTCGCYTSPSSTLYDVTRAH